MINYQLMNLLILSTDKKHIIRILKNIASPYANPHIADRSVSNMTFSPILQVAFSTYFLYVSSVSATIGNAS